MRNKYLLKNEKDTIELVANALRVKFDVYVIGAEISDSPPKFPAVSIIQTNSMVRTNFSTFNSLENVVQEEYKAEVYSNLETGKEAQTKEIAMLISDVMCDLGYERTFCEIVPNNDATINRRMIRFRNNNVI